MPERAATGDVSIKRDFARAVAVIGRDGLPEERLGRRNASVRPQQKSDRPAVFVHGAVEVEPPAPNLHVSLVNSPRAARWASQRVPTLLELGNESLDPRPNRRWGDGQPPLGQHFGQVAQAESVRNVPADTKHDDIILIPAVPKDRIAAAMAWHRRGPAVALRYMNPVAATDPVMREYTFL
jgi:hypothetical protein